MAGYASHSQTNPTMKYCKFIIFGLYNIWRKIVFRHVGVDLNWCTPECDYFYTYYTCAWHLALYLIWLKPHSAKSAKENTQPNVVFLQYIVFHLYLYIMISIYND